MAQYESALHVEQKLAQFKKSGELFGDKKNVDNYVKDKKNRIINCV